MFIKTDNYGNIVQLISVGTKPTENGYEIPNDTSREILQNIFDYAYVDGELIKRDSVDESRLAMIKDIKISNMSSMCNSVIEAGIDYNGDHYSLKHTDQINLMKLESIAMFQPDTTLFYHADGQLCRQYNSDEILTIAKLATKFITYHTTYFNFFKSHILNMTSIDEIVKLNYGVNLAPEYQAVLDDLSADCGFIMPELEDRYDYNKHLVTVDIDSLTFKDMTVINDVEFEDDLFIESEHFTDSDN